MTADTHAADAAMVRAALTVNVPSADYYGPDEAFAALDRLLVALSREQQRVKTNLLFQADLGKQLAAERSRADAAVESCRAFTMNDEEAILDALHIIGIPARDFRDIYATVDEWRRGGGSPGFMKLWRDFAAERLRREQLETAHETLQRLVAELETNTEAGAPAYAHDTLTALGDGPVTG